VECVFILLAVLVYYLRSAVVEVLFHFFISVEDFFEVLFRHVGVTAFVHDALDGCLTGGVHEAKLDQEHVRGVREYPVVHQEWLQQAH
jgi:hypothetical protein